MTAGDARRLIHASTALVLLLPDRLGWPWFQRVLLAGVMLATVIEGARLSSPGVRRWITEAVPVFRPDEGRRPSGAWWLVLAYAALSWLPPVPAAAGILVGAFADPAAAWVGTRWGSSGERRKKTWAGTVAAAGTAFLVLSLVPLAVGPRLATAVLSALAERWSGPVNDNVIVGPVAGLTVLLLG